MSTLAGAKSCTNNVIELLSYTASKDAVYLVIAMATHQANSNAENNLNLRVRLNGADKLYSQDKTFSMVRTPLVVSGVFDAKAGDKISLVVHGESPSITNTIFANITNMTIIRIS